MNRKNATRNALFTSILSLLLCVSMLVGTSFAWFTDSVSSGRNTITAGRLDIELYNDTEIDDSAKVDGNTKLFDGVNLWEPGVVVWENLTVANVGNLALKYTLVLNVLEQTTTTVGDTTYQLSDAIKVGVVDGGITAGSTRDNVIDAVTKWETLTDFTLGMDDEKLLAGKTDTFGIVLYWQPGDNDNIFNLNNDRLNGNALKLEIGVNLTATQVEEESDSFGDNYDANAGKAETKPVETPVQKLQAALNAGESVTLEEDIELADNESLSITSNVTLNLNGHTITAAGDALVVTSGATLTLNGDGEVKAGTSGVDSWNAVWANGGHVIINGGTYSVGGDSNVEATDPYHQNDVIYTKNGGTAVINGGTFLNDGTVWTLNRKDAGSEAGGEITVKGGTFQNWNPADNVSEGANTNFVAGGYAVTETRDGNDTWYTVVVDTNTEPVTASVDADTYVDSSNKDSNFTTKEELNTNSSSFRTYLRVNISNYDALTDSDQVQLILTDTTGKVDDTTTYTLKAYAPVAGVTDISFTDITWNSVDKDQGAYKQIHWNNGTELVSDGAGDQVSVDDSVITITLAYSQIADFVDENGDILLAFGTNTSGLKVGSLENETEANRPAVKIIQD